MGREGKKERTSSEAEEAAETREEEEEKERGKTLQTFSYLTLNPEISKFWFLCLGMILVNSPTKVFCCCFDCLKEVKHNV